MKGDIRLLQFFICRDFRQAKQDCYDADLIHSNLYIPKFPYHFERVFAVTCWRKDERFHKEVLEYATDYGTSIRSAHMDIEPVTDSVIFRWHKHQFPLTLTIEKPTTLTVRVILDWKVHFESYVLIERAP